MIFDKYTLRLCKPGMCGYVKWSILTIEWNKVLLLILNDFFIKFQLISFKMDEMSDIAPLLTSCVDVAKSSLFSDIAFNSSQS